VNHKRAVQLPIATHAGVQFCCAVLEPLLGVEEKLRVLVAGCGAGHEAAALQQRLQAEVVAVDVRLRPAERLLDWPDLEFIEATVEQLPFRDGCFHVVFYHHVIEHVADPQASLREIARVLRPGGWMFLGTPNRRRLFSALGAHEQCDWNPTLWTKVRENLKDWSARLRGRFRNELGAHAGFTPGELDRMLAPYFPIRQWLTAEYLRFKYGRGLRGAIARIVTAGPWLGWLAPSIYVLCGRASSLAQTDGRSPHAAEQCPDEAACQQQPLGVDR